MVFRFCLTINKSGVCQYPLRQSSLVTGHYSALAAIDLGGTKAPVVSWNYLPPEKSYTGCGRRGLRPYHWNGENKYVLPGKSEEAEENGQPGAKVDEDILGIRQGSRADTTQYAFTA